MEEAPADSRCAPGEAEGEPEGDEEGEWLLDKVVDGRGELGCVFQVMGPVALFVVEEERWIRMCRGGWGGGVDLGWAKVGSYP